jgi:hypothetical protein
LQRQANVCIGRNCEGMRCYPTRLQRKRTRSGKNCKLRMGMQRARHTSLTSCMPSMEGDYRLRACPSHTRSQIYALAGAKVAKDHYTDGMRAKEAWCRRPPQSRCVTDARRVLGSPIRVTYVSRLFQMLEESMQTQYSLRPHTLVA